MTGKERVLSALRGEKTDRTPWVPFVGCHAGALINVTADAYLQSEDHIVNGVTRAIEMYKADGIPVAFDLQIEAETLGCALTWAEQNPPAVTSHPLMTQPLESLTLPEVDQGRIPLVLSATRRLRAAHPDVALYGLITGPFTLALHLRGAQIFMDMYDTPEDVHALLAFCRDMAERMAAYYCDAGCDVIAVVDPMTSQIGPDMFAQFVTPAVAPVFAAIRAKEKNSSFFVCGHAQANIEEMCRCAPDNVSVDENIQLSYVRDVTRAHNVSFGGNMQLTVVLLFGSREDCMRNAMECLTVGGDTGYVLSPGCDIPYATPPDNIACVGDMIHDSYQQEAARALMATPPDMAVTLDMSEYGKTDKVVIDVITLDSEACAPCQYMVEAVKAVAPEFDELVIWREHKIKIPDSVEFMASLMVRNVPTICIDGEIVFVSRIPHRDELVRAIQERINMKLRRRLRRFSARLVVVGEENDAQRDTCERVYRAIREMGVDIPVECVTDPALFAAYNVDDTPAVITLQSAVKVTGKVPSIDAIKEWLKDIRM